jgi:signal transduction histidine kinase
VAPAFEDKHIRFECNFPDIPLRFAFDVNKIQQAVSNLLENALRFTAEGGTVSLALRQQFWERRSISSRHPGPERRRQTVFSPNSAVIAVADTGPGIAPEYQQEIFDDFVSIGTDTVPQGTGLGLSIARYLVQAHGGKIWVESRPGEGAQFFIALPLSMPKPVGKEAAAGSHQV